MSTPSSVKVWDLRTSEVVRSMSAQEGGPKLCGDALAVRGDYIVTGSLLPENSLELWSIKVQHYMVCVCAFYQ